MVLHALPESASSWQGAMDVQVVRRVAKPAQYLHSISGLGSPKLSAPVAEKSAEALLLHSAPVFSTKRAEKAPAVRGVLLERDYLHSSKNQSVPFPSFDRATQGSCANVSLRCSG